MDSFQIYSIKNTKSYLQGVIDEKKKATGRTPSLCLFHSALHLLSQYTPSTAEHISLTIP
jgi:hypothetical protein